MMTQILNNKNVFIVGASRGIGKSLSLEFAKNNWNCFLASRNLNDLADLKSQITENYEVKCEVHLLDVTNYEQYSNALDNCLTKFKKIDLVILNAGISIPNQFFNLNLESAREILETNLFGVINGLKTFTEYFKIQGYGKIAIVSSLADTRGFPGSSLYAASKAAVSHIAEAARIELRNNNIEIITIKPGFVKTDMTEKHKFYMPFLMNSDKAAQIIFKDIFNNKKRIYFPFFTAFSSYFLKILPSFIYEFIFRIWEK